MSPYEFGYRVTYPVAKWVGYHVVGPVVVGVLRVLFRREEVA